MIFSAKVQIEKLLLFKEYWFRKTIIFFPALESGSSKNPRTPDEHIRWIQLVFQARICIKPLIFFLPSRSQSKNFTCNGIFHRKNLLFPNVMESWRIRNDRKWCLSRHASLFKLIFLQLQLFPSSITVSMNICLSEVDFSFFKSWSSFVTSDFFPVWQEVAEVLLVLIYLTFPNCTHRNYSFDFFYGSLNWR